MKKITLSQGKSAIVDDDTFEIINQRKWYYHKGYAVSNGKRNGSEKCDPKLYMHRVINKTPCNNGEHHDFRG